MLRVPITQALPGMVLAMPLYHPRAAATVLLRAGVPLDDHSISRLREIGLRELWIEYPGLEFIANTVNPAVRESCEALAANVGETFDAVRPEMHARLEFNTYRKTIGGLLEELASRPQAAIFVQETQSLHAPAQRHATSVCLLSLLMGIKLEFYLVRERSRLAAANARDITQLGMGALLHDIGMLRLDGPTLARWNSTGNEQDPAFRHHVLLGFNMVKSELEPSAAGIVLHHHQRFDGTGFPSKHTLAGTTEHFAGSEIHVFARIVGAADIFDRLRHSAHSAGGTAVTPPQPVVRALNRMLDPSMRKGLDPIVLKALIAVTPPYPPGTIVTLSNGKRAVVTEWHADDPCRPTVVEIGELEVPPPRGEYVRSAYRLTPPLGIEVASIDGEDVREDNFYPSCPGEFDIVAVGRAMSDRLEVGGVKTAPIKKAG